MNSFFHVRILIVHEINTGRFPHQLFVFLFLNTVSVWVVSLMFDLIVFYLIGCWLQYLSSDVCSRRVLCEQICLHLFSSVYFTRFFPWPRNRENLKFVFANFAFYAKIVVVRKLLAAYSAVRVPLGKFGFNRFYLGHNSLRVYAVRLLCASDPLIYVPSMSRTASPDE